MGIGEENEVNHHLGPRVLLLMLAAAGADYPIALDAAGPFEVSRVPFQPRNPKYPRRNVFVMAQSKSVAAERSMVEGILEALADKHSQLDINFQGMSVRFPSIGMSVECTGLVTLTAHVRDITDEEKKASAAKNVSMMSK